MNALISNITPRAKIAGLSVWAVGGAIMLAAAIAMQLTREVAWGAEDFAFAAALFGVAGAAVALVLSRPMATMMRIIVLAAIATTTALIWIEAAVGIFD